jgi:hypothetical protein
MTGRCHANNADQFTENGQDFVSEICPHRSNALILNALEWVICSRNTREQGGCGGTFGLLEAIKWHPKGLGSYGTRAATLRSAEAGDSSAPGDSSRVGQYAWLRERGAIRSGLAESGYSGACRAMRAATRMGPLLHQRWLHRGLLCIACAAREELPRFIGLEAAAG